MGRKVVRVITYKDLDIYVADERAAMMRSESCNDETAEDGKKSQSPVLNKEQANALCNLKL